MTTLHLHVKDSILDKVLSLLEQFDRSEVEVVEHDAEFLAHRKHLHEQEAHYARGEMKTYTIEEADALLEKTIRKYES